MIKHEGEIERRVAVPGALGVENHRARRADQQVLRAEITVNQYALRRSRDLDERSESGASPGCARAVASR